MYKAEILKQLMIKNGWSLKHAALKLDISEQDLLVHLDDHYINDDTVFWICHTLELYPISEEPFSISEQCLGFIKALKKRINKIEELQAQLQQIINEPSLPELRDENKRLEDLNKCKDDTIEALYEIYDQNRLELSRLTALKNPTFSAVLRRLNTRLRTLFSINV